MSQNHILALSVMAEVYQANARIEGMKAENSHKLSLGLSIAYNEEAFDDEARMIADCAERLKMLAVD